MFVCILSMWDISAYVFSDQSFPESIHPVTFLASQSGDNPEVSPHISKRNLCYLISSFSSPSYYGCPQEVTFHPQLTHHKQVIPQREAEREEH
jgi:hypothetical protein